ncbi:hypothetical protein JG688_00001977 [Phytophthora aleatoria]|uniref:STAS domain-containing protein n=1 Tax=Phytophthora aleatoria TaxID=2496075 RepID=A0A8J5JBB0_9STRA|nr:hypothetical protein JG688_00001977 [Phytophthora aleatoria]
MQPRRVSDRYALPKPTWQQKVQHYAPIFRWLPNYSIQRDLKFDIVAGITVAMMLIPQEVSLSTIMHVPAHHGLYTAATAPLVYAIFGSSTVLSVASGSEVSLLVGSTLEDIEDEDERVATGIFMAFLSGCILLLSLADAGKVEQPPKSKGELLAIFLMRTLCDLGPLVVCIFGGIVGYALGPSHLKLTGEIPGGFPEPKVPWYGFTSHLIDGDRFGTIMYHALTVSVVVFLSSIAMSKRLAIQRGEDINTEQELTGIGIASVVCGFFQAMPPTGGMSRTAVNLQNAHTQLASIITCLIVVLALYTLTSTLYYLPSATLASIIIVAGWTLVEFREAKWLYRVKRDEFFVWAASFALTLGLGVLNGLIASIICCVLALMWKSKVQPVAILGELDNGRFVDRENFPEANNLGDVIAVRVESSLYFANCERVAQFIEREMVRLSTLGITTRGVVLDTFHMNDMDATTIQVLSDTQEKLAVRGVRFGIANAKSRLYDLLAATNLLKRILANDPTISVDDAVRMMRELPPLADKSTSAASGTSTASNPV